MIKENKLIKFSIDSVENPTIDYPRIERRIIGKPRRETWNTFSVYASNSKLDCGIWKSEPGHWRIEMPADECELFTVISGVCRLHDDDGTAIEAIAGDSVFIPYGFLGSFEVIEEISKTYAILSPKDTW